MRELAAKLQSEWPDFLVGTAFLTLLQPDLPLALREAVAAGAGEIHVLPLFFFSGKHVLEDIPRLIAEQQAVHRGVKLVLLEAAGRHPDFLAFLAKAGGLAS
jgi:sirohydrochlorin cobaltochelatase